MQTGSQHFGKYELRELLGRGATAEVWKAFDTQLGRYVAIKILHASHRTDTQITTRFLREAQGAASLRHPNIVQIHDFQITPTNPPQAYIVMDYIEGPTLHDYIHNTSAVGKFPPVAELVRLFTSICLAVDYAHQHRMIHRDLKPANILLDKHNTTRNPMGEPMLTDFGLVKMLDAANATSTGAILGTPLYISPEQAQGHHGNEASDIYSLGVILYELCTGVPPFRGEGEYAVFVQHISQEPPPPTQYNPNIPPAVQTVILRSLAKNPAERFAKATEFAAALADAFRAPVSIEGEAAERTYFSQEVRQGLTRQSLPTQVGVQTNPKEAETSNDATFISETPLPESTGKRRRVRWLYLSLAALVLLGLVGTIAWAFLSAHPSTVTRTTTGPAGQASFFSDEQRDDNGDTAYNDIISIRLKGVTTPTSGQSLYAWLRGNTSDSTPLYLGELSISQGNASLDYTDPHHRNLLAAIDTNQGFYTTLIVREQQTSSTPSLEATGKQVYNAAFPIKVSSVDGKSYLDHIHHLLSSDPNLNTFTLNGGILFWLLKNTEELQKEALEVRDHTDLTYVRQQFTNITYYLDGVCAQDDLSNTAGTSTTLNDNTLKHDSQISILDCNKLTKVPGYLTHIGIHLDGLVQAPDTTKDQQHLAAQIKGYLDQIRTWLNQVLDYTKQLAVLTNTQLTSPQGLNLRNKLALSATRALVGQTDAFTHNTQPGIVLLSDYARSMANLNLTASAQQ